MNNIKLIICMVNLKDDHDTWIQNNLHNAISIMFKIGRVLTYLPTSKF